MNKFNYKIFHIDGSNNVISDRLSRCLNINEFNKEIPYKELIYNNGVKDSRGVLIKDINDRLVLKAECYKKIIKEIHRISGHRGVSTVYYNLKDHFYIRNIEQ